MSCTWTTFEGEQAAKERRMRSLKERRQSAETPAEREVRQSRSESVEERKWEI